MSGSERVNTASRGNGGVDDIQGHPGRVGRAWRTRQDVWKFAAAQQISEKQALQVVLEQKAKEFKEAGAEV